MNREVLWDSSAILALLDADDSDHRKAVAASDRIVAEHRPCFVTNYVEAEAHALLLSRLGRVMARTWLLGAALPVIRATQDDEASAREIISRYDDKDWSLCDAISFAVMLRRGVRIAFTFDYHFRQFGRFEVIGLNERRLPR